MNPDECRKAFEEESDRQVKSGERTIRFSSFDWSVWKAAWNARTESNPVTREEIATAFFRKFRMVPENEVASFDRAFDAVYALQLSAPQSTLAEPSVDPIGWTWTSLGDRHFRAKSEKPHFGALSDLVKDLAPVYLHPAQQSQATDDDHVWAVVASDDESGEDIYLDELKRTWSFKPDFASLFKQSTAESKAKDFGGRAVKMSPAVIRAPQSPVVPGVDELSKIWTDAYGAAWKDPELAPWEDDLLEIEASARGWKAIHAHLLATIPQRASVVPNPDPPVQHKREIRFIDATPDKRLPFRILNAYKESGMFTDNTLELDPKSEICIKMNEWQRQRNDIIDEALHILATGGRDSREDRYREALTDLIPEEPCRFDHHGNCQEHGFFGLNGDKCPVQKAKDILNGQYDG